MRSSIDHSFVLNNNLTTQPMEKPYQTYNANMTPNGWVKEFVSLKVESIGKGGVVHHERRDFQVVNLGGSHKIFIGYDWVLYHNPVIDFQLSELEFSRCPPSCRLPTIRTVTTGTGAMVAPEPSDVPPLEEVLAECDRAIEALEETIPEYIQRLFGFDRELSGDGKVETITKKQYNEEFNEDVMVRAHGSISSDIQAKAKDDKDHNVPDAYSNFARVFDAQALNELPPHREWDHKIDLRPGWEADRKLKGKTYALDPTEISELNKFIDKNLATGRIRESKQGDSSIAAPFFFVKKKDGALRPVQDYRRINSWTIKDVWPLPLISEVMTKIKDAKIFSKMDVRWGFNTLRLRKGNEFKAAFTTHCGMFELTVMFFGLTNLPVTFQRMMDHIFAELIGQGKIIVYMDDILVFSGTLEEHQQMVNKVLEILHKHDLFLKREKCQFEKPSMDFLGMVVGNGELRMDPVKTEAVAKWPTPKNLTEIRSFMQFCNFYHTFIPSFVMITVPFNKLTKKDVKFVWADCQQSAFDMLKAAIAKHVVLMLPVPEAKFRLETDASYYAAGAVLHQIVEGRPRPLAFFSKTFDDTQHHYQIYDKELLAVMLGPRALAPLPAQHAPVRDLDRSQEPGVLP